ncbi:MAG: RCC1 domain-containing protein [Bdellovibrionota bacterium]
MKKRDVSGNRFLRIFLFVLAALTSASCVPSLLSFSHDSGIVAGPALSWHTPAVTDLSALNSATLGTITKAGIFAGGFDGTYIDYRAATSATSGELLGALWDGSNYRMTGRIYSPVTFGGGGWAAAGTQFALLDALGGAGMNLALGFDSTGMGLAVGADGVGAANTVNSLYRAASFGNAIPAIGTTLTSTPVGTQPFGGNGNGRTSATAWDATGHAYYAYVDSTANQIANVQRFTSFVSWDTGPGTHLGANVQQVSLVGDGTGVTALWLGDGLVATSLVSGASHSCALAADGKLRCWGDNSKNQLGCGSNTGCVSGGNSATPLPVAAVGGSGFLTGVVSVASGDKHTCALLADSTVRCWGDNGKSQLGSGVAGGTSSSPVQVVGVGSVGFLTSVIALAAGTSHTCALLSNTTVVCWGDQTIGQLGNGVTMGAQLAAPVAVSGGLTSVTAIAAGGNHTCVIISGGTMKCWGENADGQIGNGTVSAAENLPLAATITSVTAISAGALHTCAVLASSQVKCWGLELGGRVGDNATGATVMSTPASVVTAAGPNLSSVISVSAGAAHTCALLSTGTVMCWGDDTSGDLGDNNAGTPSGVAVQVLQPGAVAGSAIGSIQKISTGTSLSCALNSASSILCWGDNSTKQIQTAGASFSTPVDVISAVNSQLSGLVLRAASLSGDATLQNPQVISTNTIPTAAALSFGFPGFSAVADRSGDVVVVFYQNNSAVTTCSFSTSFLANKNCQVRLYAAVRNAGGVWAGPTQLDGQLTPQTTTFFQDSQGAIASTGPTYPNNIAGGVNYATPAVTYVGSGRFLVAYSVIDELFATSTVYWTGYSVGSGWDQGATILDQQTIPSTTAAKIEPFRYVNDLYFAGESGAGNAVLVAHVVDPTSTLLTGFATRAYNFEIFQYSGGAFGTGHLLDQTYKCLGSFVTGVAPLGLAAPYPCWNPSMQAGVFSTGEAFVIFPAPDTSTPTTLRLYSVEYRP